MQHKLPRSRAWQLIDQHYQLPARLRNANSAALANDAVLQVMRRLDTGSGENNVLLRRAIAQTAREIRQQRRQAHTYEWRGDDHGNS